MTSTQPARATAPTRAGRRGTSGWRLIVADPDPLARACMVDAFERSQLSVVAEAQTVGDALDAVRLLSPRLIILAAAFPGLASTQEAIRELHTLAPESAIVVTELPGANLDPLAAFKAGAAGYVIKDADMGRWLPPMLHRYARDGVPPLSPGVSEEVIKELQDARGFGSDPASLSDREIEVVNLVGKGLSNQEIAVALTVGSSTVKTHIHNLLRKLQVSNRVQLALYARRRSHED